MPEFTRQLKICESSNKLILYGDGFPLLFQFMKYVVYLFIAMFILQGVYLFIVLVGFYFTQKHTEGATLTNLLSVDVIVNKEGEVNETLVILYEVVAMLLNFLLIILTCIFWVKQMKYKNSLDTDAKTDADFAVMFQNLPLSTTKTQLHELVAAAGVDDNDIVYTNKCFEHQHILKLKQQQYYWLTMKKSLEAFRERHKDKMSQEQLAEFYPKRTMFTWPPWRKFPREVTIEEKLNEIHVELMSEENQQVKY